MDDQPYLSMNLLGAPFPYLYPRWHNHYVHSSFQNPFCTQLRTQLKTLSWRTPAEALEALLESDGTASVATTG